MAFQLPKADHKAIFEKHRRDRAIKRKVGDETEPAGEVETPPVQNVEAPTTTSSRPATPNEPVTPASETTVREDAPTAVPKADKPKDANESRNAERAIKSRNIEKSPVRPVTTKKAHQPAAKGENTVSLKIRIALPQAGQSKAYDSLAAQIGQQQAVRMVLKRAFDDLRIRLRSEKNLPAATAYLPTKDRFVTNKIISVDELAVARSSLDPSGIMNPMMFNRILAERALALFFQEENKTA